jgi:hypothetical protein
LCVTAALVKQHASVALPRADSEVQALRTIAPILAKACALELSSSGLTATAHQPPSQGPNEGKDSTTTTALAQTAANNGPTANAAATAAAVGQAGVIAGSLMTEMRRRTSALNSLSAVLLPRVDAGSPEKDLAQGLSVQARDLGV